MAKRTTKAQRADVLLEMARRWQNLHYSGMPSGTPLDEFDLEAISWTNEDPDKDLPVWASAALSEVGALGFDVE